jgi:hypothetical protein
MIEAAAPPERTTGGRRCAFPPYVSGNRWQVSEAVLEIRKTFEKPMDHPG